MKPYCSQDRGIPASETRAYTYAFIGEKAGQNDEDGVREKATFNPEIFFYVLLPPIIFHAGYSMRRKQVWLLWMYRVGLHFDGQVAGSRLWTLVRAHTTLES